MGTNQECVVIPNWRSFVNGHLKGLVSIMSAYAWPRLIVAKGCKVILGDISEFSSNRLCFMTMETVTIVRPTHIYRAWFHTLMKHPWSDQLCIHVLLQKPRIAMHACVSMSASFPCPKSVWDLAARHFCWC